ncbi:MAG: PLP-dependent aminotransferase family protein [candidate division KSB1 bacterium]|nr:PLP-dependent aminotransferase family protein [candidate division KSB1 bacterium]
MEQAPSATRGPRMAILIPNFHNPLGVSISVEKRRAIISLAEKYAVPIVEDDPYSPLRFSGQHVLGMKALDRSGTVFYIGSFSKMLAPAARLGWIVAPGELGDRITVLRESLDLESSQLWQRIVFEFLDQGHLEPHLDRLNSVNRRRKEICIRELRTHLARLGVRWTDPQGGLFIWLTLPEGIDSMRMFRRVIAKKMAYIPGGAFAVKGGYQNTIRLNFSNLADDQIPVAIQRLAEGLAEELQE